MQEKVNEFVSVCIENYKMKHDLCGSEVAIKFAEKGEIDVITKNYKKLYAVSRKMPISKLETSFRNNLRNNRELPKITDKNVHIFIPFKVAQVAKMISADRGTNSTDEMLAFYNSKTYAMLEQEKTKLWWEGPAQIYRIYKDEIKYDSL